jgi:hypothetical protein
VKVRPPHVAGEYGEPGYARRACVGRQLLIGSVALGFGGGQLIAVARGVPACAEAAGAALTRPAARAGGLPSPVRPVRLPSGRAVAGWVPLRHFGSVHSRGGRGRGRYAPDAVGSGAGAPAAGVARLSEPAASAAEITAPAATRLT